jgi:hypothetical protein
LDMKITTMKRRGSFPAESLRNPTLEAEAKALDWLALHRHYFNPLTHTNVQRLKLAIKAAAELSLVCSLAHTSTRSDVPRGDYSELASYIWHEVFQHEGMQEYLLSNPSGLPSYSLYAYLSQCGYEDVACREKLAALLEDGYIRAVESVPSMQLDLAHNLTLMGLLPDDLSVVDLYKASFLAKHPSLYPLTTADAYTVTHTIFFLTKFGRAKGSCFSAADEAYFRVALPRLLEFYLRRGNWDLSAELLFTLRVLALDKLPVYQQGWILLLISQNEDGSFSGPETEEMEGFGETAGGGGDGGDVDDTDEAWVSFRDNYHTTLATLLAVEAALAS